MNGNSFIPFLRRGRIRLGIVITIFGFLLFLLGADPAKFGQDRSAVVGFMQIAVFLAGLGVICLGGYTCLAGMRNGDPQSIISDIGMRLVGTGFLIAVATGMADVFGIGSELSPNVPNFGQWQAFGVLIGEFVIGAGFFCMIPYRLGRGKRKPSAQDQEKTNIKIDG